MTKACIFSVAELEHEYFGHRLAELEDDLFDRGLDSYAPC